MPAAVGVPSTFTVTAPAGRVTNANVGFVIEAPPGEVSGIVIDRSEGVLTLALTDDGIVEVQPGLLNVAISNGDPDATVYLRVDTDTDPLTSVVLDAGGSAVVAVTIVGRTVGTHTLTLGPTEVAVAPTAQNSVTFEVESAPMVVVGLATPQIPPMPPPAPINHWVFQAYDFSDLDSVDTYTFEINPDKVVQGFGEYTITSEPTTVNNGRVMSWEGAPVPILWTWGGHILNEDQYNELKRWGLTGQRVYLTDHLRRRYLMKIASFNAVRKRDNARLWHHTWDMSAWCLAGEGVNV